MTKLMVQHRPSSGYIITGLRPTRNLVVIAGKYLPTQHKDLY